ncbi:MAG TPA: SulP family inorganic anion transporter [Coxiellaceae bacterium]|nr:MAG: sodium-independent anion transporter [Gammaproteobacteria bacterium RIFCSPHIGHO2_12_FULL_36_30]HLB56565.1 SulP family inorganic anion transporter [Coxiellaceae bacterium]
MISIVEAYRNGLLNYKNWSKNIISGLIVAVVALPLAMAFAIASGVQPVQGLYTSIIAAFLVGVFGGTRVQIAGPTGAFIVILANITAHYGVSGLQVASFMAGFILLFMGLMKLGNVIKFIPDPVIVGFTSGIGVIIFVGEWKDFFGLPVHIPIDAHFYQKIIALCAAFPHLNLTTTGLALLSLLLMLIVPKIFKKIPGPLVAMLAATILQMIFHFKNVATIGSAFGEMPRHLPYFHIPHMSWNENINLLGSAFTIALLGSIESLLSAAASDGITGYRHNSNQELIGQGVANIFSPLFGGFAATGAIARTVANIRNGGNSPISAIVHSLALICVLVLLAPYASDIPLCALAAILFVVAYNMSDLGHFFHIIRRAPRYDMLVLLITFFLTVFTNLVIAVNVGVILAMLFFMRRMVQSVNIESENAEQYAARNPIAPVLPHDVLMYNIQGPFFFGVAQKLENALLASHTEPKVIILRLKDVPFMDMTGLETLEEILEKFREKNIAVYLCEANAKVSYKLANVGILKLVSEKRVFETLDAVLTILKIKNTK